MLPPTQAAAAWALGQAGRHTPEHAKAVAQANVLPTLLQCYLRAGSSEDLQIKVIRNDQYAYMISYMIISTQGYFRHKN